MKVTLKAGHRKKYTTAASQEASRVTPLAFRMAAETAAGESLDLSLAKRDYDNRAIARVV